MARKTGSQPQGVGRLRRAASAVKRAFSRRSREPQTLETAPATAPQPQRARSRTPRTAARPTQRQTDIPVDVLESVYTPPVTSSKTSFRSDGEDHHRDQEFARGVGDERWNDEDHFTNKSGDPRIGTHRRSYEPNEAHE